MTRVDIESARILLEAKRFAEAEAAYRELVADPTHSSEATYGLGLVYFYTRDFVKAGRAFVGALELSDTTAANDRVSANALYYLGVIAEENGDTEAAIGLYGRVLSLNSVHKSARARLGPLLSASGDSPSGAGSVAPTANQSPGPPNHEREWKGSIVGQITAINSRQEPYANVPGGVHIFDFRVQGYDAEAKSQEYAFSIRGRKVKGAIPQVGDWIEIESIFDKSGSLRPTKLRNLNTNELLSVPVGWRA